jgi:hypothetical protein
MNALAAWLKSKNLTSHSIAAAAIAIATLISTDQQVRDFLLSTFQAHPKIASSAFALAGIILKYSHSSSPAGTVATAQEIQTSPAALTQDAVDAVKPKETK